MKANFTFDEMIYNSVAKGKGIYYDNELKVIDYVKLEKDTRQLTVHCVMVQFLTVGKMKGLHLR